MVNKLFLVLFETVEQTCPLYRFGTNGSQSEQYQVFYQFNSIQFICVKVTVYPGEVQDHDDH